MFQATDKFLVFIWSNSGGGNAESTLGPPSGFEPWTPAEYPNPSPFPPQKDGEELTSKFEHRLTGQWESSTLTTS